MTGESAPPTLVSSTQASQDEVIARSRTAGIAGFPGARVVAEMWHGGDDDETDPNTLWQLCWQVVVMSLPTSIGSMLMFSIQAITASFVGRRLGSDAFAHFMIGASVFNIFGFSIGCGLVSALDTLVSQSFGRNKQNSAEIGDYLQRATLVNIILMVPLGLLFYFGKPIWILAFGEDAGSGASIFTENAIPYLFTALMTSTVSRVLAAINEPLLPMYVNAVTAVACFVLNYYYTTEDILSAVHVLTATFSIYLVLTVAMCVVHPRVTFWGRCQWPSDKLLDRAGMEEYFRVGIPSLVSVVAEWWAFEVLQVIAANIGMRQVAELNMVTAVSQMMFSISLGVSVAASVRIGNALGENKPTLARRFALASFVVDQAFNLLDVFIVIVFNRTIASVFTTEESLQTEFEWLVFLLAVHHWGDSTQYLFQGVFRGAGMQTQAVRAVLLSLWLVGLPISFLCGKILGLGTAGILLGVAVGFCVELPLLYRSFRSWDWKALSLAAAKADVRMDEATVETDSDYEADTDVSKKPLVIAH